MSAAQNNWEETLSYRIAELCADPEFQLSTAGSTTVGIGTYSAMKLKQAAELIPESAIHGADRKGDGFIFTGSATYSRNMWKPIKDNVISGQKTRSISVFQ